MRALGEVPEWTNGAVSKTAVVFMATVGSNPTLSANAKTPPSGGVLCVYKWEEGAQPTSSARTKWQSSKMYSMAMV